MASAHRILAIGGGRPVLVGLARAFQASGALFAAAADPSKLLESAGRFAPHLVLVFGSAAPNDALQQVAALRADPRFAKLPIILVASLPPKATPGVTHVVPDPSDVTEFALKVMKLLEPTAVAGPSPEGVVELSHDEGADEPIEVEVEEVPSQPARVLLVDDDPALIKLFTLVLEKNGFQVFTAADGADGLALALDMRPDAIVADLNMPRMDGWGLLRALRSDHRIGETPLVFLSCHDDYRESLRALNAGAQDYIAKGGKLDILVGRLRKLLAGRDAFAASVNGGEKATAKVEEVGVQWALRQVAASGLAATIHVRDAFWRIAVGVNNGEFTYAHGEIGQHALDGEAALAPLVVIRTGEIVFDPGNAPPAGASLGHVGQVLEQAAVRNNQNESAALDKLLTHARKLEVDEQLYNLYEQLGPPAARDIAALVRQGLTPREVIAKTDRSPVDVEETVRDLVRRRVLRLTA